MNGLLHRLKNLFNPYHCCCCCGCCACPSCKGKCNTRGRKKTLRKKK